MTTAKKSRNFRCRICDRGIDQVIEISASMGTPQREAIEGGMLQDVVTFDVGEDS
jgi:hypothetical protein